MRGGHIRLPSRRVNLCCGSQKVPGYLGIDIAMGSDLEIDLERDDLPFPDAKLEAVVMMSAINYFPRNRGKELIKEMFRVLEPGGVCRVGVQDMRALAQRYVSNDVEFFFEKLPDGRDRLEGPTIGDKFAAWFSATRSAKTDASTAMTSSPWLIYSRRPVSESSNFGSTGKAGWWKLKTWTTVLSKCFSWKRLSDDPAETGQACLSRRPDHRANAALIRHG